MDENTENTESPVESLSDQTPDEVRASLGADATEGPGESFEIETVHDEHDAIANLRPRVEEPEAVDPGPSDEQIFFEEGFSRDDEKWLSEYGEIVEGLVEPKTEADVRANAKTVKQARAEFEAEVRQERAEGQAGFAQALSLLEEGEVDEAQIAEVLRQERPELLGPFVQAWNEVDPETASAYWHQTLESEAADRIARDQRVREQAERERDGEIAVAFDRAMERAKLSERGQELVKEIVSLSPGSMTAISTPAQAAERANELVRSAIEIQRASEEQAIRQEIAAEHNRTDMDQGWGTAEPIPDIEEKIRTANVFPQARPQTVSELKAEMLEGGLDDSREAFLAKQPQPGPPDGSSNERVRKIMAR